MIEILRHRSFRRLFAAQVVALVGTGLATVALALLALLAFELAGWLGAKSGIPTALWAMAALAALGTLAAWRLWPTEDPGEIEHAHHDLPPGHPHLTDHHVDGRHRHEYLIDDLHQDWPER